MEIMVTLATRILRSRDFLVVQWSRVRLAMQGGFNPGGETKVPQASEQLSRCTASWHAPPRVRALQQETLREATEPRLSQITKEYWGLQRIQRPDLHLEGLASCYPGGRRSRGQGGDQLGFISTGLQASVMLSCTPLAAIRGWMVAWEAP